jgi:ABC-type sugar transport system substrate-binding protein
VIGWSVPIAANDYFRSVIYGQKEAAKQLGYRIRPYDANLSPDKQVSDLDLMTNAKVSGIVSA